MKKIMKELFKKVCEEELDRLKKVEQQLDELQDKCHPEPQTIEGEKTYVHIERVKVDKVVYNIDFEKLNIGELSGMLNIGATYHTPEHQLKKACPEEFRDNQQNDAAKEERQTKQPAPNVTIRGRKHLSPLFQPPFSRVCNNCDSRNTDEKGDAEYVIIKRTAGQSLS